MRFGSVRLHLRNGCLKGSGVIGLGFRFKTRSFKPSIC